MADLKISQLTGATTPLAGTEVAPIVQSSTTKKVAVSDLTANRVVAMRAVSLDSAGSSLPAGGGIVRLGNGFTYVLGSSTGNGVIVSNGDGTATVRAVSPGGSTGEVQIETGAGVLAGTFSSAGNYTPAQASKGINFTANTPAAGMTSRLLNWYEEGTYTATITPGTSGSVTLKSVSDTLQYTRIGRQVTVSGFLDVNSVSSPVGYAVINLPFAINDLTENSGRSVGTVIMDGAVSVAPNGFHAVGIEGTSEMRAYVSNSGTALSATGANQIKANTGIWVNFNYIA